MLERHERFYLTITIVGAIICLSPLFALNYLQFESDPTTTHTVSLGKLLLVLIPLTDLLLDFPANLISYFYPDERAFNRQVETSVVIRLTDIERLLFIMGVAIQSAVYFVPSTASTTTLNLVDSCSNKCGILLTLGPIIIFLHRCTTSFTHVRTTLLAVFLVIGMLFYTISSCFETGLYLSRTLETVGLAFSSASGLLFLFIVSVCATTYCRQKLGTSLARKILVSWLLSPIRRPSSRIDPNDPEVEDNDSDLYTNYIPAFHMLSIILIGLSNTLVPIIRYGDGHRRLLIFRNYITLVAEIIVLVIELRIRKNEIARGLVSYLLLDLLRWTPIHLLTLPFLFPYLLVDCPSRL